MFTLVFIRSRDQVMENWFLQSFHLSFLRQTVDLNGEEVHSYAMSLLLFRFPFVIASIETICKKSLTLN